MFIEPNGTIKTVSADIFDEIILKSICVTVLRGKLMPAFGTIRSPMNE
jgi:hypothetical protein